MAKVLVIILAFVAAAGIAAAAGPTQVRTWYDANGTQFRGRAVAFDGNTVVFEGLDGTRITVALYDLSRQDRLLIEQHFGVIGGEREDRHPDQGGEHIRGAKGNEVEKPLPPLVIGLLVVGGIVAAIGGLWFVVVAFGEGVGWGLGVMILPAVGLIFLVMHWDDAKQPFFVQLLGGGIIFGSLLLGGGSLG
ncbi:MAG: hypothetical protein JW889_06090 [Verrucomicrobia bacterium]|nr:hypothetical protein [Verrucomicrobiota bacterium]